jgi:hypothetical protein
MRIDNYTEYTPAPRRNGDVPTVPRPNGLRRIQPLAPHRKPLPEISTFVYPAPPGSPWQGSNHSNGAT